MSTADGIATVAFGAAIFTVAAGGVGIFAYHVYQKNERQSAFMASCERAGTPAHECFKLLNGGDKRRLDLNFGFGKKDSP